MVAPALVGVVVGPGVHTVAFTYDGYGSYTALFVLAIVVLLAVAVGPAAWRRWRRRPRPSTADGGSGTMEGHDDPPQP
jgi:hypothetical protein